MSEVSAQSADAESEDISPLLLREIKLNKKFSDIHPIFDKIDELRKQWKFMTLLAIKDWNREIYIMLGFGIIAFLLGAISTDIISGGDPSSTGMDGLLGVGSFSFFQMLLSILAWVVFVYFIWTEFPVMRVHSITMILIWNGMIFANVFFHQNNPNWPSNMSLSDMMYGTLIMLVVIFFTYFFWKAVSDTRDLHVQVHHFHEDVRVMEDEMYEYSLTGWGTLLIVWFITVFFSSWSGVNFIASRNNDANILLFAHIISGIIIVPQIVMITWYPQRLLGDKIKISTSAALTAEIEMSQGEINLSADAKCPECEAPVKIAFELDGQISVPCSSSTCNTFGIIGTKCKKCSSEHPSRFTCAQCDTSIPYVDTIPDSEAW